MRILHVGKHFRPHRGGIETVLASITDGLLDAGDDVAVIVAESPAGGPATSGEDIHGPGSGRRGLLIRASAQGMINSQPLTFGLADVLHRTVRDFRPDLVHLHLPNPLAAAAWLGHRASGRWDGPPLAVWHHADITRQRIGRWLVRPAVAACHRAAAGICVSSAGLRDGSRELHRYRAKVAVIPFGIDPGPWEEVVPSRDGPFLFVGRLVPYKGIEVLLEAVRRVSEARLVLVGEGPLQERLAAQISRLGLAERVRLTGPLPAADLAAAMSSARALILPSLDASETFGLVQLEAMASGVPVVVSDLPGGAASVGDPDRTCLLTAPGDPGALASALRRLLEEEGLAAGLGEAGRLRFHELYTKDRMIAGLRRWYAGLIASGGAAPALEE